MSLPDYCVYIGAHTVGYTQRPGRVLGSGLLGGATVINIFTVRTKTSDRVTRPRASSSVPNRGSPPRNRVRSMEFEPTPADRNQANTSEAETKVELCTRKQFTSSESKLLRYLHFQSELEMRNIGKHFSFALKQIAFL